MDNKIFDRTIPEIKDIKHKAEKEIYHILINLEKELNLQVDTINKQTTAGGTLDPWCSMSIKFKLPF